MQSVNRYQMSEAVWANMERCEQEAKSAAPGSFAQRGAVAKMQRAARLLKRLDGGNDPTSKEVAAYFGKGVRFSE